MNAEFVICIKNDGYPASLVMNKIYRILADDEAAKRGLLRVIDESGADYLYPEVYFVLAEPAEVLERQSRADL